MSKIAVAKRVRCFRCMRRSLALMAWFLRGRSKYRFDVETSETASVDIHTCVSARALENRESGREALKTKKTRLTPFSNTPRVFVLCPRCLIRPRFVLFRLRLFLGLRFHEFCYPSKACSQRRPTACLQSIERVLMPKQDEERNHERKCHSFVRRTAVLVYYTSKNMFVYMRVTFLCCCLVLLKRRESGFSRLTRRINDNGVRTALSLARCLRSERVESAKRSPALVFSPLGRPVSSRKQNIRTFQRDSRL